MRRLCLLLLTVIAGCGGADKGADGPVSLILVNGRVYTLDWPEAAPDGTIMTVPGFWDGKEFWRVRLRRCTGWSRCLTI